MRTLKTRLLSLALAIVMVLSMMPAALATDAVPDPVDNESGVVVYTNTAELSAGELNHVMTAKTGYVGSNSVNDAAEKQFATEEAAIAAGAVCSITGATTSGGELVTYYYSVVTGVVTDNYVAEEKKSYHLYGDANGEVVFKLFTDVNDVVIAKSQNLFYVGNPYARVIIDLNGHTITETGTNASYTLFVGATSTSVVKATLKNGTIVRCAPQHAILFGNSSAALNANPTELLIENVKFYTTGSAGSAMSVRQNANITIKNSVLYSTVKAVIQATPSSKFTPGNTQTANVNVVDSQLLSANASGYAVNASAAAASYDQPVLTVYVSGEGESFLASNAAGGCSVRSTVTYADNMERAAAESTTYSVNGVSTTSYVVPFRNTCQAVIGEDFYPTVADAMAAAADGDTVKLLANADAVELASGVILDPNGFAVASVTDLAGNAVPANEDGTYGPVVAGTVKAETADGSKFYLDLAAALAATTEGEIKLLAAASSDSAITLAEGVSLNVNGFELTAPAVVDIVGTTIEAVDGVYDPRNVMAEYTSPDGSVKQNMSLAGALTAAEAAEGSTVKLLKDVTVVANDPYTDLVDNTYFYKATVDTTIDFNGKTLTAHAYGIVTENNAIDGAVPEVHLTILGNGGKLVVPGSKAAFNINNGWADVSDLTIVCPYVDVEVNPMHFAGEGKTSTLTNVTLESYRYIGVSLNHTLVLDGCEITAARKGTIFFSSSENSVVKIQGTENVFNSADGLTGGSSTAVIDHEGLVQLTGTLPGKSTKTRVFVPEGTVAFNDANGNYVLNDGETAYTAVADFAAVENAAIVLTADAEAVTLAASSSLSTVYADVAAVTTVVDGVTYARVADSGTYAAIEATYQAAEDETVYAGSFAGMLGLSQDDTMGGGTVTLLKSITLDGAYYGDNNSYPVNLTKRGLTLDLNGNTLEHVREAHLIQFLRDAKDAEGNYVQDRLIVKNGTLIANKSTVSVRGGGNATLENVVIRSATNTQPAVWFGAQGETAGDNYMKNCELYTTGSAVAINHDSNNTLYVSGTYVETETAYAFSVGKADSVVTLQGITNEIRTPYNELNNSTETAQKGSIQVQSNMIVTEPAEEGGKYVITFEPLDGAAFVDYDENGVFSDGDSMHKNLEDALAEAEGWAIVVLNEDNAADVNLVEGTTLNAGAYAQTGKVYVLNAAGGVAYEILEDEGVYVATLAPEVEYILGETVYAATLNRALKAVADETLGGGTVKFLQSFDFDVTYPIDLKDCTATFDLNGNTLTGASHMFRYNEGNAAATGRLTVTSSNGRGTIEVRNSAFRIIGGNVTIENVDVIGTNDRDDIAVHPVTLVNPNSENYIKNSTITRVDTSADKELNPGYTVILSTSGNGYLEIEDSTISNDVYYPLSIDGKDTVKITGTNVVFNHVTESPFNDNGTFTFDAGKTSLTTPVIEGEGEGAVITGYVTTITDLVKGEPVVGFTAPNAEEVLYYLTPNGINDPANGTYATVEYALGAAVADWKEAGYVGEIDLYDDLYITSRTIIGLSGTNMVMQVSIEGAEFVLDLNGNTINYGSEDGTVVPKSGSSGNPALFSPNAKDVYMEVKNGTINWAGNRAFYLTGSSSNIDDSTKTRTDAKFTNLTVNYNGTGHLFSYNNAPGTTITISGGTWNANKQLAISPSNKTDGTSVYITDGAVINANGTACVKIGNNATAQPTLYVDNATFNTPAASVDEIFANYDATVTSINWKLGNAQGGVSRATTTATETEGVYQTVIALASAEDFVAQVGENKYFTVAEAVKASAAYDTVTLIKTPAETAITLKASTYMTVAEGVDMTDVTVAYENGVEVAVVDGVYTPVEVIYTYGDIEVKGTAQQAFGAWYANGSQGTITLMADLTLSDTNHTASPDTRRYIELASGSSLTMNLNGYTVMNVTNVNDTANGPTLFTVSGAKGDPIHLTVNGGANAEDTTKVGKILWGGSRALVAVGASTQRNFTGTITLNNLEIENYSRGTTTVTVQGTTAEMGNVVTFHNVKHIGYNGLYTGHTENTNTKVVLSGNTTTYHRGNFKQAPVALHADETVVIGENVKFYVVEARSGALAGYVTETVDGFSNYATPDYTTEKIEGDIAEGVTFKATTNATNQGYTDAVVTGTYTLQAYKAVAAEAPTYSIYTTGDEFGTIVAVPTEAKQGEVVSLTVNPGTADTSVAVTVVGKTTGTAYRVSSDYKFIMPAEEVDVIAVFTQATYKVSLYEAGMENGTVVAVPDEAVAGTTVTLTPAPAEGYMLDTLYVKTADGDEVPVTAANTFVMPMADVIVYATFKVVPASYNVYVNGGENGTVVATPATAAAGQKVALNVTAAEGYELQTLTVFAFTTGAPVEVAADNTFIMPEGGANVYASFAAKKYAITVTGAENGAITTDASAAEGKTVVVEVNPAEGYELDTLTVTTASGEAVAVNGVTFVMPAEAVTVSATFKSSKVYYGVTVNAATNGTITADKAEAAEGDIVTLTFAAKEGYALNSLTVNGAEIAVTGNTATFEMPAQAVTVNSKFIKKIILSGTNMGLGSTLTLNFAINTQTLTGNDNYAILTKVDCYGGTKSVRVDQEDWLLYSGKIYLAGMSIAAKEMNDKITAVFYNAKDQVVSVEKVDSVTEYATRMLDKASVNTVAKTRTTYVDMLNYGAAAQVQFNYDTANLANAGLTDAQQAWATGDVTLTNNLVKGTGYAGSLLGLEDVITLSFVFNNSALGKDMSSLYAVFTYTDHYNKAQSVTLQGSEFQAYSGTLTRIPCTSLAVADFRSVVDCKVYNANGDVVANAQDSIESYAQRQSGKTGTTAATVAAIAKFCAASYAYFH